MSQRSDVEIEDVESFRQRARLWLKDNMPRADEAQGGAMFGSVEEDEVELARVANNRVLQRKLFDAGFAGITVATDYGGAGLTAAHQLAFNQELSGYQYPAQIQVPTFTPCLAVINEFGSHEQKLRHLPPILKGEAIWMQFLSEPSGGSDVAGAQTSAVRDGDEWILNGSKIWTTGAWWSDWGLCLARTNWDVPKHRGLSVFMLKIHQSGIEVHRIEMLNGSKEFCQEFITDVRIPDADRIGDVDDGWTVGIRWMFHERTVGGGSQFVTRPAGGGGQGGMEAMGGGASGLMALARKRGTIDDPRTRELIGEAHSLGVASGELTKRVFGGMRTGRFTDQAAALGRLMGGEIGTRLSTISWEIAGSGAVAWSDDEQTIGNRGVGFLSRQAACIAGGTTEMARNVISERVLGMPRERTVDKDVPFRDVPKGPPSR